MTNQTSNTQPEKGPKSLVSCGQCGRFFKPRGLARHKTVAHPSSFLNVEETVSVPAPTDFLENLFNDILEARKRLRVVKIIPKQIRQQVALAFQEVLAGVIATSTIRDWRRLLTFAYVVLRLPPSGRHSGQVYKVIQQNLTDFRKDKSTCYANISIEKLQMESRTTLQRRK